MNILILSGEPRAAGTFIFGSLYHKIKSLQAVEDRQHDSGGDGRPRKRNGPADGFDGVSIEDGEAGALKDFDVLRTAMGGHDKGHENRPLPVHTPGPFRIIDISQNAGPDVFKVLLQIAGTSRACRSLMLIAITGKASRLAGGARFPS